MFTSGFAVNCANGEYKIKLKIEIAKIKIGKRLRKDPGDIDELAESIKRYGLFSPIILEDLNNGKYKLLAGWRRLQAHQILQKTSIDSKIIHE